MKVEIALKKTNPNFKGFYTKIPYLANLRKMIKNYDKIMAQMPKEPMGDEARVNPESPEPNVQLEIDVEEEEQSSLSTWVAKSKRRKKTLNAPKK